MPQAVPLIERLDADMTTNEVATTLERLQFNQDGSAVSWPQIDSQIRDYFLGLLPRNHAPRVNR
jgi:hypothetical protein